MSMNKKALLSAVICYLIWGIQPAYWNLLDEYNPLFILCSRIIFTFVFTLILTACTGRMKVFLNALRDKSIMRNLIPASVILTFNWGIFIWAVNSGHILDTSIGYFMNPLMVFLFGILLFREKSTKLQLTAVALAFTGVLISVIAYGSFPFVSVSIALSFAAYGVFKKKTGADPVVGITVESMVMAPFALVFALLVIPESFITVTTGGALLLVLSGVATAVPLIMYARAINEIPYIVVGFLQYIGPTISLIYGLTRGETLSASQIISYVFIILGLIVFSIALIRSSKEDAAAT